MTLREKQSLFVRLVARLIDEATLRGYELTFGETWRTPEQAARNAALGIGTATSLHTQRLAVDFNLFRNGVWLNKTEDWKELGEFWKSLHPLCRWGGDFKRPDGNHLSLEHEGRK